MSESLTEQLVTANRILADLGILRGFGHVSVREPGSDEMLISRSRSPGLVTEDDVIRMALDGTVLDDEDARPYKETVVHRAIYRHRDDVNAVVHHHAHEIMPFTVSDVDIVPAYQNGALFADGVPTFSDYDDRYGQLVVGEAEGERMAENLGDCRAQLLEGHGSNVVGSNVKEAVIATRCFVMNARYQFQAEQLGGLSYGERTDESMRSQVEDILLADIAVDRLWEYLSTSAWGN